MRTKQIETDYEILLRLSRLDDYQRFCDWAEHIDLDKEDYWLWLVEKEENEQRMKK
jgi:hypothetical protein